MDCETIDHSGVVYPTFAGVVHGLFHASRGVQRREVELDELPAVENALERVDLMLRVAPLDVIAESPPSSCSRSPGSPRTAPAGRTPTLRVTIVQGGGPQGTHAVEAGDSAEVFARHLEATRTIAPGSTDLVVWPENVVDVAVFVGSERAPA